MLLFRDASLIDGTGSPPRPADVLVTGDRIASIAPAGTAAVPGDGRTVDASGLVLAPGFIDAHSHADNAPLLGEGEIDLSKLTQGVTTEVTGNCGFSLAPAPEAHRADVARLCDRLFPPMAYDWETFPQLFGRWAAAGPVTNVLPLAGHHTLRAAVLGLTGRAATTVETRAMAGHLDAALAAGAAGLSSGLAYPPGMFAGAGELDALLARLDSRHLYATHLRNEGTGLLDSIDEAVDAARRAGCRLQVSHLKAAGRRAWGQIAPALRRLDEAFDAGVRVHHDVYPYEANSTMLVSCLPPWAQEGGDAAVLARLHDAAALDRLDREVGRAGNDWDDWVAAAGWDGIVIALAADPRQEGRTLAEIARTTGTTPFRALTGILVASDLRAWMCAFAMTDADVRAALTHPRAVVGSDGAPPGRGGKPHPRRFGTFTRVLAHYVRETQALDLPTAIAKMTSLPASIFGLAGRGVVTPGAAADLVLFDPRTVADRATFAEPTLTSTGIEMVLVNGAVALERGHARGVRAGRRLTGRR
jgi:N-acyl-D-amino-acid deacylase